MYFNNSRTTILSMLTLIIFNFCLKECANWRHFACLFSLYIILNFPSKLNIENKIDCHSGFALNFIDLQKMLIFTKHREHDNCSLTRNGGMHVSAFNIDHTIIKRTRHIFHGAHFRGTFAQVQTLNSHVYIKDHGIVKTALHFVCSYLSADFLCPGHTSRIL